MSPPERRDPVEDDPVEIWGRRIGRGLGVVALGILAWLLGRQLQFW
ncbi:hypothetical protein [Methylobacterium terricola]|nr:hypothetical protein [Methylobacterium terricola]